MSKVKCVDCGFLAFRTKWDSGWGIPHLAEADQEMRESDFRSFPGVIYEFRPVCFMRVAEFQEDILNLRPTPPPEAYPPIIHRERCCKEFTTWQQGFTPKEHLEENRRRADADFRYEEAETARHWQAEEAEKNRIFQREMMASRTRKDILVFGVVVTLFIVTATILGAFIERGFWWEDRTPIVEIRAPSTP